MNLPLYNILLGDCEGITKMSLVEQPAIDSNFIALAKESEPEPMKFSLDEEQHIVFGCSLRADYPIYRESKSMGQYYVVFSKEVIRELYEKFMKDKHQFDVNVNHQTDVDGVYMIQSFIKDKASGIDPAGFEDIADGSWFSAYKVENEEVWNRVKEGEFKGFSIELISNLELIQGTTESNLEKVEKEDEIDTLINELLED